MEINEQTKAVSDRLDKLGFPRDENSTFKKDVNAAVNAALLSGEAQAVTLTRERSSFIINVAPGKSDPDKVYINTIYVTGANGQEVRFPMGTAQPTLKAMENVSNGAWILLKGYQPKDLEKPKNDVWIQIKGGEKTFISSEKYSVLKEGAEVLGYKLSADDVKNLERGNNALTNECMKYEKGSNVPVGKNENTVALYADPVGNRIGYKDLGKQLDLKKNFSEAVNPAIDKAKAAEQAVQTTKAETKRGRKVGQQRAIS